MNRILLASDFHLHNYPNLGLDPKTGLFRRLEEQKQVLNQIAQLIIKEDIKYFIFGGDLFHRCGEIPVECLNIAYKFFNYLKEKGVVIYFVRGNHDLIVRKNPKWFHYSGKIFESGEPLLSDKIKLVHFDEEVNYEEIKGYDLVVLHKTPLKAKLGKYVFNEGVNWKLLAQNNKWVFFGHIHQRAQLSSNCYILGAPMHLDFGDEGERGVYILEKDSVRFIKLKYPEFKTVKTIKEVNKEDNNYYRVLEATEKYEIPKVLSIVKPKVFKERLKFNSFEELLKNWLILNNKEDSYLEEISFILKNNKIPNERCFSGRIKRIEIENFLSIKKISLNIDKGFTYIKGDNGVGKSALFEALYWGLYGKTTKGLTGDDVIREGVEKAPDTTVKIFLENSQGTDSIVIKRSRKKGLEVYKNFKTRVDLVEGRLQDQRQQILENWLGFSEKLFLNTCYFSQENLKLLAEMGNKDRVNLVTDLLNFDFYDDLYDKCHEKIKEFEINEIPMYQDEIKEIEQKIGILQAKKEEKQKELEFFKNNKDNYLEKIKEYNINIEKLEKKKTLLKEEIIEEKDFDIEIVSLEKQQQDLEKKVEILEKDILLKKEEKNEVERDLVKLKERFLVKENEIKKVELKIENLKKLNPNERCDKCGSLILEEHKEKYIQEENIRKNLLEKEKIGVSKEGALFKHKLSQIDLYIRKKELEKEAYMKDFSDIQSQIKNLYVLKIEKEKTKNRYIKEKSDLDNQILKYKELIKVQKKEFENFNFKIKDIEKETKDYEKRIQEKEAQLEEVRQKLNLFLQKIDKLSFWKEAFSSRGIRALLLDKFCNEFNSIVATYISLISKGTMSLMLTPKKETKKGEERNELGLVIFNEGISRKYQSLSGGEKRRVNIALCLALNKWVSLKNNLPQGILGILILDEIFSFIDNKGGDIIGNLLREEGNNKALFVIAHTSSLEAFALKVITVYKNPNQETQLLEDNEK